MTYTLDYGSLQIAEAPNLGKEERIEPSGTLFPLQDIPKLLAREMNPLTEIPSDLGVAQFGSVLYTATFLAPQRETSW